MVMNLRGVERCSTARSSSAAKRPPRPARRAATSRPSTDASMRAEILSYSRSRGLFAGISLDGTSLRPDNDATAEVYGRKMTAREIITSDHMAVPPASPRLSSTCLQKRAPYNHSGRKEVAVRTWATREPLQCPREQLRVRTLRGRPHGLPRAS